MKTCFDKIKLSHLHTFCSTLEGTQVRDINNIKRKYSETATGFDETLSFLEALKIVQHESGKLSLAKSFSSAQSSLDEFKKQILSVLCSCNGEISEELKRFLVNFQIEAGNISFRATELEKIKFSDTRNLLLELNFISVEADHSTYLINPIHADLFVRQFSKGRLSPRVLKKKLAEKEALGLAAEKAVVHFEIKRLTNIPFDQSEIELISEQNVLAGYDIKSFENFLDPESRRIDRYIEVKAVSIKDYGFFWSRLEMDIARVFGERYYLYLLPISLPNGFDFEKLLMISNPYKNIYSNSGEWRKEEESIFFQKNS